MKWTRSRSAPAAVSLGTRDRRSVVLVTDVDHVHWAPVEVSRELAARRDRAARSPRSAVFPIPSRPAQSVTPAAGIRALPYPRRPFDRHRRRPESTAGPERRRASPRSFRASSLDSFTTTAKSCVCKPCRHSPTARREIRRASSADSRTALSSRSVDGITAVDLDDCGCPRHLVSEALKLRGVAIGCHASGVPASSASSAGGSRARVVAILRTGGYLLQRSWRRISGSASGDVGCRGRRSSRSGLRWA